MLFLDDTIKNDLSQSSTILQCMLALLDHEAGKFHKQPEVIDVENNIAMINMDKMHTDQILAVCEYVNSHFSRADKKPSCYHLQIDDTIVVCESVDLSQYNRLI